MRGANTPYGHLLTAMVTPFDDNGRVDLGRAGEIARYLLSHGTETVVVNGTTGESPTTSMTEKAEIVRAVVAAVGGSHVIAGAGGNNTAEIVELAERSAAAGACALLSVAPYYNKPSQEGLYRHFRAIAQSVGTLPVLLYNVPGRTVTNIEPSTTARLANDVPNIIGIKEASANMAQVAEIARLTSDDFLIYSGDDATILPTLALGGAGVISVISHVVGPDLAALHSAWFAGEIDEARRLFANTLPLTRALFSAPSPSPTKYALSLIGEPSGGVRLPLTELSSVEENAVKSALREYGFSV